MRVSVSGVRQKSGRVKWRDRLWSRIGGLPIQWRHVHCMHWVCRHQRVHWGHRRVWRRGRGQARRAGGRGQARREWWGGAFCCLQRGTFLYGKRIGHAKINTKLWPDKSCRQVPKVKTLVTTTFNLKCWFLNVDFWMLIFDYVISKVRVLKITDGVGMDVDNLLSDFYWSPRQSQTREGTVIRVSV